MHCNARNHAIGNQNPETLLAEKHEDFLKWRFGIFFHFNMGTFTDQEWATGHEDPLLFNPDKLDCGQWVREAKNAGMTYAVLTVKHTGGWCLWDSKYTDHDMTAMKNYMDGKGDIVREFTDACHANGMKVGLYYCLPGDYSENKLRPGQEDLHGMPPEAQGNYQDFIEKQITELFTQYGDIDITFIDQFMNPYTGEHWQRLKSLIHELQPGCIVVANNASDYKDTDIISYEYPWLVSQGKPGVPPADNDQVAEVSDCIVNGQIWFWHAANWIVLKPADEIVGRLRYSNAHKANYLLNVQPDNHGLISGKYLETLRKIGEINRRDGFIE